MIMPNCILFVAPLSLSFQRHRHSRSVIIVKTNDNIIYFSTRSVCLQYVVFTYQFNILNSHTIIHKNITIVACISTAYVSQYIIMARLLLDYIINCILYV